MDKFVMKERHLIFWRTKRTWLLWTQGWYCLKNSKNPGNLLIKKPLKFQSQISQQRMMQFRHNPWQKEITGRTRQIQIKSGRAIVPPALPVPTVLVKNQKTKDIGIFENKITWLPNKVEMLTKQKLNKLQNKSIFWKRKTSFYLTKLKSSSLNHPCSRRCWKSMNLRFKQCNITFIRCVIYLLVII